MASLLDALFKQLPQPAPYTNKQQPSELEKLFMEFYAKNPNMLDAANAALAQVSPAAGQMKQPERPQGISLYNILKDKTLYRRDF